MLCIGAGAATKPPDVTVSTVDPAVMQIDEPRFLGTTIPKGAALIDESGQEFTVGELLGKPLILLLSYYGCDGTCPTMNENLARVLAGVVRFQLGQDYRVLTVSFDKQDTPQTAAAFLDKTPTVASQIGKGWRHAILKSRETDTEQFAGSVGFRFFWSRPDKTFLHPNVLVFLTPEGRVARYIYGTRMDARAVELALIDADWGRISESAALFDIITGACFSYNYADGKYQPNYALLVGLGSFVFGLGLMGMGLWLYRKRMGEETLHVH